jgi:Ca2+-binding RTX toxin-like protein
VIVGGADKDTVDYSTSTTGVTIDLSNVGVASTGGDAAGDIVTEVEVLKGSNVANDTLTGDSSANELYGNGGDDILAGLAGADKLTGGAGTDIVDYSASSAAVTVNLTTNAVSGGHAASDTLNTIEGVYGSAYADTLTGNSSANILRSGAGDDVIRGEAGNDTFYITATDNVQMYGGTGNDTFVFAASSATDTTSNIDTIEDFASGDIIDTNAIAGLDFSDLYIASSGGYKIIQDMGGDGVSGGTDNGDVFYLKVKYSGTITSSFFDFA